MFDEGFYAVSQISPAQHDPPVAGETLQTNISPQPKDLPFESAAWMRLAQPYHVVDLEIRHHG